MTLRDLITLPQTGSALRDMSFILIRGWTLLIVSFVLFCYLSFRRRASLHPSAVVATLAESLGRSSLVLFTLFMTLNYAKALIGDWGFFLLLPYFAPHLTVGAMVWPLSSALAEGSRGAVAITAITCAGVIALAAIEPFWKIRLS